MTQISSIIVPSYLEAQTNRRALYLERAPLYPNVWLKEGADDIDFSYRVANRETLDVVVWSPPDYFYNSWVAAGVRILRLQVRITPGDPSLPYEDIYSLVVRRLETRFPRRPFQGAGWLKENRLEPPRKR